MAKRPRMMSLDETGLTAFQCPCLLKLGREGAGRGRLVDFLKSRPSLSIRTTNLVELFLLEEGMSRCHKTGITPVHKPNKGGIQESLQAGWTVTLT